MRNKKWWNRLMAAVMSMALLLPAPVASAAIQETEYDEKAQGEYERLQKAEEVKGEISEDEWGYWESADGTLEISSYKGSEREIQIPAEIGGKKVTGIGEYAFSMETELTKIVIPEGVTSIGPSAFSSCSSLTDIVIPEGVTNIGSYAFASCRGLTNIVIPEQVKSIGTGALSSCSSLTSIQVADGNKVYDSRENCNAIIEKESKTLIAGCKKTVIPDGVISIGDSAFRGCSRLNSMIIPKGITSIGNNAFMECSSLTSIVLPEGLRQIGSYAFHLCRGLTNIVIPEGVMSIGQRVFSNCSSLKNIVIPKGITSIGSSMFFGCSSLTGVTLPRGVTSIGSEAFYGCSALTSLVIPDGVTSIGGYAFSGCSSLADVIIPKSVTSIGGEVFERCSGLTIQCYEGSAAHQYAVDNDIAYKLLDKQSQPTAPSQVHSHKYDTTITKATVRKNGTITKKCSVCGHTVKTTIYYPKTIKLSKTEYTYNGKTRKPSITVKDSKGKTIAASNYKITYQKGRKNVGIYTATIKFKNNYSGSVKKTFTIRPGKTSLSSFKNIKTKSFVVKWKKQSKQTSGYVIQYSTNSKFKKGNMTKTVKSYKTSSQKISKLKANKKYYVRVRTYKTVKVNGKSKKIYSEWSKAKSVKTKKK